MKKAISIINASRKNDGITIGICRTASILKNLGYDVKWYQVLDRYTTKSLPDYDHLILGVKTAPEIISMGITRTRFVSKRFDINNKGLILITEPTLINFMQNPMTSIVKFHDFRAFTEYSDKFLTRFLYKMKIRKLRKIQYAIFSTEFMKNEAENQGITPSMSVTIKDKPRFNLQKEHIDLSLGHLKNGVITITCISTDRPYKNLALFLEIAKELYRNDPEGYRFILVSKVGKELSKKIHRENIIEVVEEVVDIKDIYNRTDIVIVPSKYEGFCLPLVEATYFGIPVVSFQLPPFVELLGKYELFQNSDDLSIWTKSIEKLRDPFYYEQISEFLINRAEAIEAENTEEKLRLFIDSIFEKAFSGTNKDHVI